MEKMSSLVVVLLLLQLDDFTITSANYYPGNLPAGISTSTTNYPVTVTRRRNSSANDKLTYAKLLGTEQFLFVGLSKCYLSAELSPPAGVCPYHSIFQTSNLHIHPNCPEFRMHLVLRDNEPPDVLIFGATKMHGNMIAKQFPILWPKQNLNTTITTVYMFEKMRINMIDSYSYVDGIVHDEVVATLFDSKYGMLYVLRNTSIEKGYDSLECVTFYVQYTADDRRLIFHKRDSSQNLHPSNNARMLWTEDPYHRKYYYVEKRATDKKIILFAVPFDSIMEIFRDGKSGVAVQAFRSDNFRNLHGKIVVVCNGLNPSAQFDPSTAMVLLFDNEYCTLQEVSSGSKCMIKDLDINEQPQVFTRRSLFYWLIALIVALVLGLVALFICLCRRQKIMETTFTKDSCSYFPYYPRFSPDLSI